MYPKIGIRPIIDGRQFGIRESLEDQTMNMAKAAKTLIEENVRYSDGTPVQCVISPSTIGGGAEAAASEEFFSTQNVCATLSVTPCWCYGSETMDLNPLTIKAVWGFNGTERPGAVYLAAAMALHAQRGLPAFSIYGHDVQDADDTSIPEDVKEKILRFARCAIAAGQMRNKAYVNIGGVAMGIGGSYCNSDFFQNYLGIRAEWVDMTEILRRINLEIYDQEEYEKAAKWAMIRCPEGMDINKEIPLDKKVDPFEFKRPHTDEHKEGDWEFCIKMTLIVRDILQGNPKLAKMGWLEESRGRNGILGGFPESLRGVWSDDVPALRVLGAIEVMEKNGIPFDPERDYEPCSPLAEEGYQAAKRLLLKNPDLTGIFAIKDSIALGAIRAFRDMGLRVPKDISVVGFDGVLYSKYSVPRLTTIQQDVVALARKGVEDLLMRISYDSSAVHEQIPYRFVNGESVARPRD